MGNHESTHSGQSGETGDAVATFSPEPRQSSLRGVHPSGATGLPRSTNEPGCETQSVEGSTWRPPQMVGGYRIEDSAGHGGMGQVYRAWDVALHRRVALKFILGIEPDVVARERFMREARAMAQFQHANVVMIYGVDVFEGHPYLISRAPSPATRSTTSRPLERRSVSIACSGVCAIGPATLKEVLTEISTPMRRPSAFKYA